MFEDVFTKPINNNQEIELLTSLLEIAGDEHVELKAYYTEKLKPGPMVIHSFEECKQRIKARRKK